ncbi:protein decapentaplegic-like [Hetaerina americana]|uniref:protein decapentaplegic-like n=1 Tax=Hetaerina americana TaxID=62018 RepID=UPI003A7F5CFF
MGSIRRHEECEDVGEGGVRVPEIGKPKARSQKHILSFKIPEAKRGERLKSAELRLTLPWNVRNQKKFAKSDMVQVFLAPKNEDPNPPPTVRLDSTPVNYPTRAHFNATLNFTPTVSLNVTAALFPDRKMSEPGAHSHGSPLELLHLEVHLLGSDHATAFVTPEGYDRAKKRQNPVPRGTEDPPQLLLFYSLGMQPQGRRSSKVDGKWRWKRSAKDVYEEETNMIWNGMAELPRVKEMPGIKKKPPRNSCRRQPLYVDFAEINYDTWIVAPNGYEAYQCAGKCFFPVSEHLSPTKHAILQTLVHSVSPRKAARACCVPTRLESISVLYVDTNGVLTYHFNYEDMVVAECGCR